MFFNTFITAGFRPRNQNAKSIQFQVTTIGVVSCRTDVMPWYLRVLILFIILFPSWYFDKPWNWSPYKSSSLFCVIFPCWPWRLRYERKGYKTFSEIPLEVAFAGTASTVESTRGQVWYLADIVIFGWYCDIWSKLWYLAEIVIFGWYCDIMLILWYLADIVIFGWYCEFQTIVTSRNI